MKIVSVLTTESDGGAEFAAVDLLDALVDRGHEAVLLTNRPELRRDTRVETRMVDLGPKLSRSSYRRIRVRFPQLSHRFRAALRCEQPYDVLMVNYKKEQLLTLTLPRRTKRPLTVWAEWGPVPFELRSGTPNLLYRLAASRADIVLAISEGTRQSLIGAGVPGHKVHVLPNAVHTDEIRYAEGGRLAVREQLGIPPTAFVVGCVSRFHPKKRNDVVIEAVSAMDSDTHLVLAGAGETEPSLRRLASRLGDRAHFVPTPTSDVADVYSAFDVSVFCPSPTEGAPRAVILGMLASRPVVSTGAEGVSDMLTRGGTITTPENNAEALAHELARYRDDPDLRAVDGAAGRSYAEDTYAAAGVAARFEKLVLDALESRGRSTRRATRRR